VPNEKEISRYQHPVVIQTDDSVARGITCGGYLGLNRAQFAELENAGGITLKESRRALNGIAAGWLSHDRALNSPRPGEFRARIGSIRAHVEKAHAESDFYGSEASVFDRHLLHWLREQVPGANEALAQLALLPHLIEFLRKAEQSLPTDTGRPRPMDDHRFIHYLADLFEVHGGKARAYLTSYEGPDAGNGYADTPFRRFVHEFYGFLSLKSRRTRSGLDEGIRRALIERREKQTV
jgi:hypothetical protein